MSFAILSCANEDAARWQSRIDQMPLNYRDVLFTPAYARVQQSIGQGPCYAAVYTWEEFFILQPFMQRGQELVSFYGGGGPISNLMGAADYRLWLWFEQEFAKWRKDCRVEGEYVRLHPRFDKEQRRTLRESGLNIEHLREAVSVNIDLADSDLLHSFSRNRQRGIRAAVDHGVCVWPTHDTELFGNLYRESMDRLKADEGWRYPNTVWGTYMFELMDEYCTIHCARVGPEVVGMLLTIHGYGKAYAHFLAAGSTAYAGGVGDLLYYESMKHARDTGCKTYFMGGGTTSDPNDPLLAYKSSFSKVRVPVSFYKRQFLPHESVSDVDSSEAQPA